MSRKHLLALVALVLGLVACAPPAPPNIPVAAQRFFVQDVDFLSDTGRSPSIALDSSGLPHLAYLGLNQKLKKGQIPPARPLSLPMIPAVLTADLTKSGVWDHGSVIATKEITKPLPLKRHDEVALALDSSGNGHVAFTERGVLKYATQSSGIYGTPVRIAKTSVDGLSIAVDASKRPWVSWLTGDRLEVATKHGKRWTTQTVARASNPGGMPARTSIKAGPKGPVIAYSDANGQGPMLATQSGGGWSTQPIDPGGGGFGISLALDKDGDPHVAYYTASGEVRNAHSFAGAPWRAGDIAQAGAEHPAGWSASIAVDKKNHEWIAYYDSSADKVKLVDNPGGGFKRVPVTNTLNGELPQLAVSPDGNTVWIAWYDHVNLDLVVGEYGVTAPPKFALVIPSGIPVGGASSGPPIGTCSPSGSTVDVVAQSIAFNAPCFAAPAKQAFTINFDNKDSGVPHNFAVYDSQGGKLLFGAQPTQLLTGPGTATYRVTPQPPGTYYFQCDVHPTTMNGTFVVK